MISGLRKPNPLHRKPNTLPARKRMTLALGMLCKGGLVIAADTQLTWSDGRTEDTVKVNSLACNTGSYAFACACSDSDAAETLISAIKSDLALTDPKSFRDMESVVTEKMKEWYRDCRSEEDRPSFRLVLGASIADELGLYLCEPPNTVSRKTLENSQGFAGVGEGNAVIKSVFGSLFSGLPSPRACLNEISYLMYRAKKDCASSVGGHTDAVLIRPQSEPLLIQRSDMAQAESFGLLMDNALSRTASAIISEAYLTDREVLDLASDIHTKGLAYKSSLQFHSKTGEEIL